MAKCSRCNATIKADANFCDVCGAKVAVNLCTNSDCDNYKQSVRLPTKSKFCSLCGSQTTEGVKYVNIRLMSFDEPDDISNVLTDETFISGVEMALDAGEISTSGLQRRLRLGYARAGRLIDQMEQLGIISEPSGSAPRKVLITPQQWENMKNNPSNN